MKRRIAAILLTMAMLGSMGINAYGEETEKGPELEEGYTVQEDGYTSVVSWCSNEDKNIYGKFYYPEGFEEGQTYPTIIMSHGLGSTAQMVERALWPEKAVKAGYVVYTFDFCGGSINSNSDMDYYDMSVMTEVSDLNAVMDFVKAQAYVDPERLFLLGQSQGGAVSALTAAKRADEVRAMILVYPALCIADNLHEFIPDINEVTGDTVETAAGILGAVYAKDAYDLDIMSEISGYKGDVLLIHGINDKMVPYTYSEEAITTAYADSASELLLIGGEKSTHGFEMIYEEGRDYAEEAGIDFLNAHLEEPQEVEE